MIPGNPGLPAFYEPFLKDIQASLGGTAVVASVSQLEHCPGPCATPPSTTCPSLDEQIRAKAQFIEEQQSEHPGLPTIVISHSLGGYMTVEVRMRLTQDTVRSFAHLGGRMHTGHEALPQAKLSSHPSVPVAVSYGRDHLWPATALLSYGAYSDDNEPDVQDVQALPGVGFAFEHRLCDRPQRARSQGDRAAGDQSFCGLADHHTRTRRARGDSCTGSGHVGEVRTADTLLLV